MHPTPETDAFEQWLTINEPEQWRANHKRTAFARKLEIEKAQALQKLERMKLTLAALTNAGNVR